MNQQVVRAVAVSRITPPIERTETARSAVPPLIGQHVVPIPGPNMPTEPKPFPKSKQEAFLDSPLYAAFALEGREEEELVKFFYGPGTLDAWCENCGKMSVFRISSQLPSHGEPNKSLPHKGLIEISASCPRGIEDSYSSGCRSSLYIVFLKDFNTVQKIGQSPSAADLALGALDLAFKELDKDRRRELGTAIRLQAHGVGIGSFVYLRRIFEALLEEAHVQARSDEGWDEKAYEKSRTSERIVLVRSHLPSRLVSAAGLYGVLSKGVHELSEAECLENFDLVKSAIELILKERQEHKRFESVIKQVRDSRDKEELPS